MLHAVLKLREKIQKYKRQCSDMDTAEVNKGNLIYHTMKKMSACMVKTMVIHC